MQKRRLGCCTCWIWRVTQERGTNALTRTQWMEAYCEFNVPSRNRLFLLSNRSKSKCFQALDRDGRIPVYGWRRVLLPIVYKSIWFLIIIAFIPFLYVRSSIWINLFRCIRIQNMLSWRRGWLLWAWLCLGEWACARLWLPRVASIIPKCHTFSSIFWWRLLQQFRCSERLPHFRRIPSQAFSKFDIFT